MDRKKLELRPNEPTQLKLLFDDCVEGESQYGRYYLYAMGNGNGESYSYFAPEEVHEVLKGLNKDAEVEITKLVSKNGKKLETVIDVKILSEGQDSSSSSDESNNNTYFDAMLTSFQEAIKIQEILQNGLVKIDQIAISLFIARTKAGGLS